MTEEQEIEAVRCLKSLEFFTRYFFKHKTGRKFIVNDHHKIIFNALTKVAKGEIKNLIINIAPRYSKTELAVKNFIAWCMALNSACKFIHLSYSDGLALDNSEEIKDLITSQEYLDLFPNVKIKQDSRAKNKWYTNNGGGVLARAAGGQVTGFGAGRVDEETEDIKEFLTLIEQLQDFSGAIIIDDPIKPEDADSDTIRSKVNKRFDSTIRSRVNSRNTPIIIIMQRVNEDDLCGYLLQNEPDEWEVISLPVIKSDGTALWEHKHTIEELHRLKKANPVVFETQYMQDPTPEDGLVFAKSDLNYYKTDDIDIFEADFRSAFIDVADTGTDFHSVPVSCNFGNKIYIHDVLFTTQATTENIPLTAKILNKYKPENTRIETNFGGSMYKQLLSTHTKVRLLQIRAKSHKHTRIITLSGFIKEFCYFRQDYAPGSDYDKFMRNLNKYLGSGKSPHDDAPDSLHGLCNMIRKFYPVLYRDFVLIQDKED